MSTYLDANVWHILNTTGAGLKTTITNRDDDQFATTGQLIGSSIPSRSILSGSAAVHYPDGGSAVIMAAAGTYDVEIRYRTGAGTVSAKNRKLWVRAEAY